LIRCYSCPHYIRFNEAKLAEDTSYWKAVEKNVGFSPRAVASDERSRARFLENRLRLNRRLGDNPHHYLPYDNAGHSNYVPATFGPVTSPAVCGSHHGYGVCKNKEAHKGMFFRGEDATDMDFYKNKHWWCHSPLCPRCCLSGFAVVRARSMESRFKTAEKFGFFNPEHVVASPPPSMRDIPIPKLKILVRDAMRVRGAPDFAMIIHGYRVNQLRTMQVWSPHAHLLAFIKDGYERCRLCEGHTKEECLGCSGFNGREMRNYPLDKILVSVKGKRETIGGSCWYELNHSLVHVGLKRSNIVSWYGELVCSRFKSEMLKPVSVCGICGARLESGSPKHYHPRDIGQRGYRASFLDCE
jgi:hypothetical protein